MSLENVGPSQGTVLDGLNMLRDRCIGSNAILIHKLHQLRFRQRFRRLRPTLRELETLQVHLRWLMVHTEPKR